MNISRPRRLLLRTGAAAALIGALLGAPAHAAPEISVQVDPYLVISTPGESLYDITINPNGATNPQLYISLQQVTTIASVRLFDPSGAASCTSSGSSLSCSRSGDAALPLRIGITPKSAPSAKAVSEHLSYSASADGGSARYGSVQVSIVDGGLLAVTEGGWFEQDAVPGDTISAPVTFTNVGNKPASAVSLVAYVSAGLVTQQYKNCSYGVNPVGVTVVVRCTLPVSVAPGASFKVQSLRAVVAPFGMGGLRFSGAVFVQGQESEPPAGYTFTPGLGTEELVATPWNGTPTNQTSEIYFDTLVHVSNVRDIAAVGATVAGGIGDQVDVRIGTYNVGPGAISAFGSGGEHVTRFHFEVPAWATVVSVPNDCYSPEVLPNGTLNWNNFVANVPGQRHYDCSGPATYLGVGQYSLVTFRLKITALTGANGATSFDSAHEPIWNPDVNAANDTAPITLAGAKTPPPRVIPTWPPGGGKPPIRG